MLILFKLSNYPQSFKQNGIALTTPESRLVKVFDIVELTREENSRKSTI